MGEIQEENRKNGTSSWVIQPLDKGDFYVKRFRGTSLIGTLIKYTTLNIQQVRVRSLHKQNLY